MFLSRYRDCGYFIFRMPSFFVLGRVPMKPMLMKNLLKVRSVTGAFPVPLPGSVLSLRIFRTASATASTLMGRSNFKYPFRATSMAILCHRIAAALCGGVRMLLNRRIEASLSFRLFWANLPDAPLTLRSLSSSPTAAYQARSYSVLTSRTTFFRVVGTARKSHRVELKGQSFQSIAGMLALKVAVVLFYHRYARPADLADRKQVQVPYYKVRYC